MYKASTVFIGVLIAVMVSMNGVLAGHTGSMFSVLVVHIVGLLTVGTLVLIKKEKVRRSEKIPLYLFCAGTIGVLLTYLNNTCVAALGVSLTLALGLLGQSILSCFIDHFGLFEMDINKFSWKKLIGFALSLLGVVIMVIY